VLHKGREEMIKHDEFNTSHYAWANDVSRFINREMSWLNFNQRVMEEAENAANPLLERLKFLSISASNLDEFIMVRVAGLKEQLWHDVEKTSDDGLTARKQLQFMREEIRKILDAQQHCWMGLRHLLARQGMQVCDIAVLTAADEQWLRQYFLEAIFPALTPIAIDPAHPFPFLPNRGLAALYELRHSKTGKLQTSVLMLPTKLERFVRIKGSRSRFVMLEQVVQHYIQELFPAFELVNASLFRIIRDSDLEVEDEAEDLVRHYENALKRRRRGRIIHVETLGSVSDHHVQFLKEHLHVRSDMLVGLAQVVDVSALMELYSAGAADLKFPPYQVRFPERIDDYAGDCFAAIRAKDIVVHHPFESFDVVLQFLLQAAADPDVVAIKQTLYRTSSDSPIVKALIAAAEAGKSVTALVELKARFDEEANIKWARDMERAGVQVVYGFVSLKTHAKMSLVVRREKGKLKTYAHFGTGNYHPVTAKIYTDVSFFTCDVALCRDASKVFNFLTGYGEQSFEEIIVSPLSLRSSLKQLIAQEIAHARAGRPAHIWAKMNALVDPEIADALYVASCEGVQVELIVRGICCLRPNVVGMSENIRVKSVVGRFLEHSRIYCFGNGHAMPSAHAKVYIASADWMVRNFDWRVEVMIPIKNPTVHAQILDQIMVANLKDDVQSWTLTADATYQRVMPEGAGFSAHAYFMTNPSLSGRGKALHRSAGKDRMKLVKASEKQKKTRKKMPLKTAKQKKG
jgi:polyphosphate kinase